MNKLNKNYKFIYSFITFLVMLSYSPTSQSAQYFNNVALCFEDRLDWDHDGNDLCLRISIVMDDVLSGDPITYLITPVSLGAADNLELQYALASSSASLHDEGLRKDITVGDAIYTMGEFFDGCSGNYFINVGTGLDCNPQEKAVTVTDHGLSVSSDADLVQTVLDVFRLRNVSQGITISKSNVGFMFVLPDDQLAVVKENHGTWYDNWDLSTANCDPTVGMSSCNLTTLTNDTNSIVRSSLGAGVDKNPKHRAEFAITKSSGTTANYSSGGTPVFNGSRWDIKSVSDKSNISSYFNESQADGASVNRTGYVHYKHRHICHIVECHGGGGGGGGCAPGNAPCDYSFCPCHTTSNGCSSGDANGDNVCWWDSGTSSCKGADAITNSTDCTSAVFYWSGGQCVGGNGSAHTCSYTDCTYMGNAASTSQCSGTHVSFGSITIRSHNGTSYIGGGSIVFSNGAAYGSSPGGELPANANCYSGGECASWSCDYTNNRCN